MISEIWGYFALVINFVTKLGEKKNLAAANLISSSQDLEPKSMWIVPLLFTREKITNFQSSEKK